MKIKSQTQKKQQKTILHFTLLFDIITVLVLQTKILKHELKQGMALYSIYIYTVKLLKLLYIVVAKIGHKKKIMENFHLFVYSVATNEWCRGILFSPKVY